MNRGYTHRVACGLILGCLPTHIHVGDQNHARNVHAGVRDAAVHTCRIYLLLIEKVSW